MILVIYFSNGYFRRTVCLSLLLHSQRVKFAGINDIVSSMHQLHWISLSLSLYIYIYCYNAHFFMEILIAIAFILYLNLHINISLFIVLTIHLTIMIRLYEVKETSLHGYLNFTKGNITSLVIQNKIPIGINSNLKSHL